MSQNWKTLAHAQLERANVTLEIGEFDRKLLAKQAQGAVFVCNQLQLGIDEWVLIALLADHFDTPQILYPYPTPPPRTLRPLIFSPENKGLPQALDQLVFAKKLSKAVAQGQAVGIALDFSDNPLAYLGKNMLRRRTLKQLRKAGVPVVPLHIDAGQTMGSLWRRALPGLPFQYTLVEEPIHITVRVGTSITPKTIQGFKGTRSWGKFLQAKIFSLGLPYNITESDLAHTPQPSAQALAEEGDRATIAAEIAALKPEQKIATRGQFDVFVVPFSDIPNTMFEIARLRELTFRAVGEGTGKARDMDEYDLYYLQLVIWDRDAQRVAGGYRLGLGDQIFARFGVNGFYTYSVFKMDTAFFPILRQSVELGRSYVVPDYQRHRLPLFLLWKGILMFILTNPQYRYLYGPVSISKDYSDAAKGVIVEFIRRHFWDKNLSRLVAPRKPFKPKIKDVDTKLLAKHLPEEFDALDAFIESIEPAHFKVPVLFRQYLRLNARFLAFNVDPNFSDCLDGLILLDIQEVPESMLEALQQER